MALAFEPELLSARRRVQLREEQRVRLIIEPVDVGGDADRPTALNRFRAASRA